MLIKKIALKNFRCYVDDEIEFSTDPNKNVTVIVGNNRAGKTTLLKAFIWCLYRINKFDTQFLLNKDVECNMSIGDTEYVKVILDLQHNDYEYRITTNEAYSKSSNGVVSITKRAITTIVKKTKNGDSIPLNGDAAINEINSILPEELSQYFFLAGEDVAAITKKSSLSKAVRQILGLESIKNGISYFSQTNATSVYNTIKKDLQLVSTGGDRFSDAKLTEEDILLDIEEAENIIEESTKNLESFKIKEEQLNAELSANRDVSSYQREREEALHDKEKAKKQKNECFSTMISNINTSSALAKYFLTYSYIKNDVKSKLNVSSLLNRPTISHISETAIDDIISRGYCVCGCKIEKDNDAYKHLIEEKKYIPPKDFSGNVRKYSDAEELEITYMPNTRKNIERLGSDILVAIERYEDADERIKDLNHKLEGRQDVGAIARELSECTHQINQLSQRISLNAGKIDVLKANLDKVRTRLKDAEVKNEANKKVKLYLAYCDQIYSILNNTLHSKTRGAREKLQEKVQYYYDQMFVGNRQVKISEDFNVTTIDPNTGHIDETGGTEAIKNFSFIGGLSSLARELRFSDDDFEGEEEAYPLILDAPFSHTDEHHTSSSAKVLPLTSEQVVFIVMRKDFNIAEPFLKDKIGAKYTIQNEHETLTILNKEEC